MVRMKQTHLTPSSTPPLSRFRAALGVCARGLVVGAVLAGTGVGFGVGMTACASPKTRVAWARPYPEATASGGVADIQVIREETRITMTNTTAREFGPSTVWINMQWALPIAGFKPGETMTLDLAQFRNEYHERFRAGGFFAVERPDTVALTQIETAGVEGKAEMVGLVTVKGAAE